MLDLRDNPRYLIKDLAVGEQFIDENGETQEVTASANGCISTVKVSS